jgi:hypothetical protein
MSLSNFDWKSEILTQDTVIDSFESEDSELNDFLFNAELAQTTEKPKQKELMQKGGEIFSALLDDGMQVSGTETTFEINSNIP